MKKIYLFVASMFIAATTFAQQYDLAVELTTPVSGSTIAVEDVGNVAFELINYGPGAADATPSSGNGIWMTVQVIDPIAQSVVAQYDLDGQENSVTGIQFQGTLEANMYSEFEAGEVVIPTTNLQDGYMVVIAVLGIAPNDQAAIMNLVQNGDPNDADNENNFDYFYIGESSSLTINTKDIKVYPNPANDFVNFQVDGLENGTVIISSITGQEVVNTTLNGVTKVDVADLNNGVYIYKIVDANGEIVKTNKLVINK